MTLVGGGDAKEKAQMMENSVTDYLDPTSDSEDHLAWTWWSYPQLDLTDNFLETLMPEELHPFDAHFKMDELLETKSLAETLPSTSLKIDEQSPLRSASDGRSDSSVLGVIPRATELLVKVSLNAESTKHMILTKAIEAMEELIVLCNIGAPLWNLRDDGVTENLDIIKYKQAFRAVDSMDNPTEMHEAYANWTMEKKSDSKNIIEHLNGQIGMSKLPLTKNLQIEASREIIVVNMDQLHVVEILMDVNRWSATFANIVSRAMILGVLFHERQESYEGTLQVMTAEFHAPTVLVPARSACFARYCKRLDEDTLGVVDFSLESIFGNPFLRYRRWPSGCLIQKLAEGCSKVTWVEIGAVDNTLVHHIYQPIVSSGFAFGAKRWVSAITRHIDWVEALVPRRDIQYNNANISECGRENLLKLAERMMRTYFEEVNGCSTNAWWPLPMYGASDLRVTTINNNYGDLGKPLGCTVAFTTSVRLPVPPAKVFDFLSDKTTRGKWDILAYNHVVQEVLFIGTSENKRSNVSVLQVNAAPNQTSTLYLQNTWTDWTGSYIVYSPLDIEAMNALLDGGNPDTIAILPSGFAILPEMPTLHGVDGHRSLLTIAFHIMDVSGRAQDNQLPFETIDVIHNIITQTIESIHTGSKCHGPPEGGDFHIYQSWRWPKRKRQRTDADDKKKE